MHTLERMAKSSLPIIAAAIRTQIRLKRYIDSISHTTGHEAELSEEKNDSTAAYAAETTIVSSFVTSVRSDTSKEDKTKQNNKDR